MSMVLLYSKLPELAISETRIAKITYNSYNLPNAEFAFFESYCDESNCDCRRVLINVIEKDDEEIKAVISYGWENIEYYKKRIGDSNSAIEATIPFLDPLFKQTEIAENLLELFKDIILTDEKYIARLKNHYEIFKKYIKENRNSNDEIRKKIKISRNALCICGSGIKYKNCCAKKA